MEARLFDLKQLVRFDAAPQKVAVYAADKSLGAMRCLEPGQEVFLHRHPNADDVRICPEGDAGLYFAGNGQEIPIREGRGWRPGAGGGDPRDEKHGEEAVCFYRRRSTGPGGSGKALNAESHANDRK